MYNGGGPEGRRQSTSERVLRGLYLKRSRLDNDHLSKQSMHQRQEGQSRLESTRTFALPLCKMTISIDVTSRANF